MTFSTIPYTDLSSEVDIDNVTALIVGEIPPEALPFLEGKLIMVSKRGKLSEVVDEIKLRRSKRYRRSGPESTTESINCKFTACMNVEHEGKCITLFGGTIACRTETHLSFESEECGRLNVEADLARRNLTDGHETDSE